MSSQSSPQHPEFSAQPRRPARLLLVDDDQLQRFVARKALECAGNQVVDIASGEELMAHCQAQTAVPAAIDAILLDACMPGMSGFDTCRALRQIPGFADVPIVIATGLEDTDSIEQAFSAGATDYVVKPVNWQILHHRLQTLIVAQHQCRQGQLSEARVETLLDGYPDAVLMLDEEAVILGRQGTASIPMELRSRVEPGACLLECLPPASLASALSAWNGSREEGAIQTFLISEHDGRHPYVVEARLLIGLHGERLCLLRDQTEHYLAEQRLLNLAYHDNVTGLANATRVSELLWQMLQTQNSPVAVLRCVIDNHAALHRRLDLCGLQRLASEFAQRLQALAQQLYTTQATPILGRLADNEFVVAMPVQGEIVALEQALAQWPGRLQTGYRFDDCDLTLQLRLGLALSSDAGELPDDLLRAAGCACAHPVVAGSGPIQRYTEQINQQVKQRQDMERLLRRDIARGDLLLHYQPKFSLQQGQLVGMEALVRWHSEELGSVSPGDFVPLAEQSGLMLPLTELVIDQALEQITRWQAAGQPVVPVSINLSGSHLRHPGIVQQLRDAMHERALHHRFVELEVTESVMIDGDGGAINHLHALREMGFRIAVDDFGTGYSSFSYLQQLPVDVLKIDRSFVAHVDRDNTAAAIARAIITVGHDLGLEVLAEGVEQQSQLATLQAMDCDTVQGFYTGRPVPADAFEHLFDGRFSL